MAMKSPTPTTTVTTTTTITTPNTLKLDSPTITFTPHEKTLLKSPRRTIEKKMSSKTLTIPRNTTTTTLKNRPDISFILGDMPQNDDDDDCGGESGALEIRVPYEIKVKYFYLHSKV